MAERAKLRCNNCGHRFEADVLSEREKKDARDEGEPRR